jgi:hypothetical protein
MAVEEPDRAGVPLQCRELALEALIEGFCVMPHLVCLRRCGSRAHLHRCRSGLRDEDQRKQANE